MATVDVVDCVACGGNSHPKLATRPSENPDYSYEADCPLAGTVIYG